MPRVFVQPDYPRGMRLMRRRYHAELHTDLKQLPGYRYAGDIESGAYLVPEELMNAAGAICRKWGVDYIFTQGWPPLLHRPDLVLPEAMPHQREGVRRILKSGGQLLHYPTGTGKSATILFALNTLQVQNVLILCPAVVRTGWVDQARKWLKRDITVYDSGKQLTEHFKPNAPGWCCTSYEIAARHPEIADAKWQGLILDESHYVKESRSIRSKVALDISEKLPLDAVRIGSSATPSTIEPKDLYHQLAVLNPGVNGFAGRVGTWWQFVNRYSNVEQKLNEVTGERYGHNVRGINEDHYMELVQRLAVTVHTVTAEEVAPYMPPYTLETLRYKTKDKKLRELTKAWYKLARKEQLRGAEEIIRASHVQKAVLAADLAANSIEVNPHVAIVTYYHETADAIMAALRKVPDLKDVPIVRVPSDGPIKKRLTAIDQIKQKQRCIAVMTMKSIGEGINNLAFFRHAIIAELYPSPALLVQAIGRFPRLGNQLGSLITLLLLEGTLDEPTAKVLVRRAENINRLFKQGGTEEKIQTALTHKLSEQEFLDGIVNAAMSLEDD